jgi:hypothetical protein
MDKFLDFISGGFFNYLGAMVRFPFSKEKFSVLVKETQSNNYGMLVTTVIIFIVFVLIRYL